MSGAPMIPFRRPALPAVHRVRFGDHAGFRGIYVGLIVDMSSDWSGCIVAMRNEFNGKVAETPYATETLHRMALRR